VMVEAETVSLLNTTMNALILCIKEEVDKDT